MPKTKRKIATLQHKRKPKPKVNFNENEEDYMCIALTLMGFSRNFVSRQTGLLPHQCDYRAHLLGITRRQFRDCHSDVAKSILNNSLTATERYINQYYVTKQ